MQLTTDTTTTTTYSYSYIDYTLIYRVMVKSACTFKPSCDGGILSPLGKLSENDCAFLANSNFQPISSTPELHFLWKVQADFTNTLVHPIYHFSHHISLFYHYQDVPDLRPQPLFGPSEGDIADLAERVHRLVQLHTGQPRGQRTGNNAGWPKRNPPSSSQILDRPLCTTFGHYSSIRGA